jgi:hypothetical protein
MEVESHLPRKAVQTSLDRLFRKIDDSRDTRRQKYIWRYYFSHAMLTYNRAHLKYR